MEEAGLNQPPGNQLAAAPGPQASNVKALRAWVLYDFAYIIWSIDILSIHGQLFLQDVLKASDSLWAWTVTLAMVVVAAR